MCLYFESFFVPTSFWDKHSNWVIIVYLSLIWTNLYDKLIIKKKSKPRAFNLISGRLPKVPGWRPSCVWPSFTSHRDHVMRWHINEDMPFIKLKLVTWGVKLGQALKEPWRGHNIDLHSWSGLLCTSLPPGCMWKIVFVKSELFLTPLDKCEHVSISI